jgi:hypothetical protein
MAKLSPEQLIKRSEKAWRKKDEWRDLYKDAYEFAVPQRSLYDGYYEGGVGGAKKMNRVFDSTAITSTQRFANRMQAGIFPSHSRFARLEPGPEVPGAKKSQLQAVLDVYGERMFTAMRTSNFDIAIGEFLLDLAVGTAVMLVQPGREPLAVTYTPVPEFLVAIEEGPGGTVDAVYRKRKINGEAIASEWRDAKIPPNLARLIKEKPTDDVDLLEVTRYDYDDAYWYYCVLWKGEAKMDREYIVERKKKYSPWVVARYMKNSGEVYGRGPVVTALPDIKTLNKTLELLLKNASIGVAGVYTGADDGILNPQTVRIIPGAIIPVARNGGPQGPSLMPLKAGGDINLTQIVINDLRMSVRAALLDDSQPLDTQAPRSATEYADRAQKLAQNLGSAFGRLITETLTPIISITLQVLDERGIIDLPLKVNGMEVRVVPVSPIAMVQNMDDINALRSFAGMSAEMDQLPTTHINKDAAKDYIADKLGVPMQVRLTREQREQQADELKAIQTDALATAAASAGQQAGAELAAPEAAAA